MARIAPTDCDPVSPENIQAREGGDDIFPQPAVVTGGPDVPRAIRVAAMADFRSVIALAEDFHREDGHPLLSAGAAALKAILEPGADLGCILVLTVAGNICGYGVLCFGYSVEYGGRDAFVDDLYVAPAFRNKGHGANLLAAIEDMARKAECRALHLEVMPGNRVERWYLKTGYRDRSSRLLSKVLLTSGK